jgi:hypothetical protein
MCIWDKHSLYSLQFVGKYVYRKHLSLCTVIRQHQIWQLTVREKFLSYVGVNTILLRSTVMCPVPPAYEFTSLLWSCVECYILLFKFVDVCYLVSGICPLSVSRKRPHCCRRFMCSCSQIKAYKSWVKELFWVRYLCIFIEDQRLLAGDSVTCFCIFVEVQVLSAGDNRFMVHEWKICWKLNPQIKPGPQHTSTDWQEAQKYPDMRYPPADSVYCERKENYNQDWERCMWWMYQPADVIC